MSATTTQLLSRSFANCVMTLYLLKVHLQTSLSIPMLCIEREGMINI